MAEEIRVLLVEPMKRPRLVTVEHTLENLQKLVGGDIECVYPWNEDLVGLVCNGEGKYNGSLPNRMLEDYDLIFGTFFICGLTEEEFGSISDELAAKYEKKFRCPELYSRDMNGHIVRMVVCAGDPPNADG